MGDDSNQEQSWKRSGDRAEWKTPVVVEKKKNLTWVRGLLSSWTVVSIGGGLLYAVLRLCDVTTISYFESVGIVALCFLIRVIDLGVQDAVKAKRAE